MEVGFGWRGERGNIDFLFFNFLYAPLLLLCCWRLMKRGVLGGRWWDKYEGKHLQGFGGGFLGVPWARETFPK